MTKQELTEKITAEIKLASALETIVEKTKEIDRLQGIIDRLQDALVATTAPRAYEDRVAAQTTPVPQDVEDIKRHRKQADINAELLYRMEQPTFKDADDMIAQLTGVTASEVFASKSVHDNGES